MLREEVGSIACVIKLNRYLYVLQLGFLGLVGGASMFNIKDASRSDVL